TTSGDAIDDGCGGIPNCYSVYAHSDTTLYVVDLTVKSLMTVGPFNAPAQDVITDLAVAPDGTIWVISETALYTADSTDGHVTLKGSLSACGSRGVALTFTAAGLLYTGDFKGAICQIDITGATPVVGAPTMLQNNMALSGDLVAVGDGTVFGTVYNLGDAANKGTQLSNVLAKLDLTTGAVTQLGATGFPKLFGTSFAHGKVMGFSHDGSGDVVELDPAAGTGVLYATFMDPMTQKGIAFAGAGVNALIQIIE
ncbi:MAG TPA: hypothetical protein VGO00_24900, partial [Kofleriaceae bacterium]|nr:hypothetical protein [Kofleriaceae bacterium]